MSRPSHRADRRPTWTSRVEEFFRRCDDILNVSDVVAGTGASPDQARASLHHLSVRAGVLDSVIQGGERYYLLTGEDRRQRTCLERVPEPPGSRARRARTTVRQAG